MTKYGNPRPTAKIVGNRLTKYIKTFARISKIMFGQAGGEPVLPE